MMNLRGLSKASRAKLIAVTICIPLFGCGSGDDDKQGVFLDSPVVGLNYTGTETVPGLTNSEGQFNYKLDETIHFSIGELALGSAVGEEILTPVSITQDAVDSKDQRVTNKLIFLQTLDADGDLNNGIQINEITRNIVSDQAVSINFDQSSSDFSSSIASLVTMLEDAQAFSDTDPRVRSIISATAALEHFSRSTSERIVVNTSEGKLKGFAANDNTWQFLGVPYAQPPLGNLRWRAPQPLEARKGVRDAVAWSNQAAQNPGLQRFGEGGMSEDSLYLNITAPKEAKKLPVMVWFHGGGFTALTSNTKPFNNPTALVTKDVIQISVNHRLGPFGYIAHPELSEESGYNGSGNYGQLDLIAALTWIQKNIKKFGGDPGNVTIFGESGGGRKVLSLMASPLAKGLFHKAISQSGTLYPDTRSLEAAEIIGSQLQANLGVESLEAMREKSWLEIVAASASLQPYTNVDNSYLPSTERVSFESGEQNDVPFMFVINTNDTPDPINTVKNVFPWMADNSQANHFATLFNHLPIGWRSKGLKAYHGSELAYLFNMPTSLITHYLLGLVIDPATGESLVVGDLNQNGISGDTSDVYLSTGITSTEFSGTDAEVVDRMLTIWTNFAKTGNPSIQGEINYPVYNSDTQSYVELNTATDIENNIADLFDEE